MYELLEIRLAKFPKTAKHTLGIANRGKGAIIIGIEQKNDNTLKRSSNFYRSI